MTDSTQTRTATLAGGCFWCTEAVFLQLEGVELVESGYIGGTTSDPDYHAVCSGETGHAEAIRIAFDFESISYGDLLDVFFATHDPTQLNRQGNDVGTQYRSAIFPHDAEQEQIARAKIEEVQKTSAEPIVTTIEPLSDWHRAEEDHQDYWQRRGTRNPYCLAVIPPKLQKLKKGFAERLKAPA